MRSRRKPLYFDGLSDVLNEVAGCFLGLITFPD